MSFVYLQFKAAKIKRLCDAYKQEKKWAMEKDAGEEPELTCHEKYQQFWKRVRRKNRDMWLRICMRSPDSFLTKLKTFGTFENHILKSVVGFLGGVTLTYFLFMFFVFALNINLKMATIICIFIGQILALGLAFSMRVRCIVFMLLPVFISKHGRQALMACVFILVMTGPAKNSLHNVGVLSESLVCGQESLKKAAADIAEMIKQPFIALKAAIKDIMKTVKKVVSQLKDSLMAIKRAVMAVLGVFKAAGEWLASIFNICSKKVGTPFERCEKSFDGAVLDCLAKLGPLFSWLCSIAYITKLVCYVVKVFDFICMAIDIVGAIAENAVAGIKRKLNEFVSHLRGIFFVKVDFDHSFSFETNTSRGAEEIRAGMVTEIQHRLNKILVVFDLMSWTFSLFFLFILIKVLHYRHKYLVSDRFDNHYITGRFRELDMQRARHDQETLLPLNRREKKEYIPISSLWLVYSERVKLTKSVVFLGASSFKMLIHLIIDYGLYWVLAQIRFYGRFQSEVEAPPTVRVKVEGDGAVSDIYRSTVKAFSPMDGSSQLDTVPCLPDPMPPNFSRYTQIGMLIFYAWLTAFIEPYGLRMRQVVMNFYHPDRAAQRAVWLYNKVLRARGSFLKFARRQLRRAAVGATAIEQVTFMERLRASFPLLDRLLGSSNQEACLLCGHVARKTDDAPLVRCSKPGCIGKYCVNCYASLLNICTICKEPVEYGDLSDQDEEVDSSDEERPRQRRRAPGTDQVGNHEVEAGPSADETDSSALSDLPYSYQYAKFSERPPSRDPSPIRYQWRDVEGQYQGELASLQDFYREPVDADVLDEKAPGGDARMAALMRHSVSVKIERETSGRRSRSPLEGSNDYKKVIAKKLARFFRFDSTTTRKSLGQNAMEDEDEGASEGEKANGGYDGDYSEDEVDDDEPPKIRRVNMKANRPGHERNRKESDERKRSRRSGLEDEDEYVHRDANDDGEVDGRKADDDDEEDEVDSREDNVVFKKEPEANKQRVKLEENRPRIRRREVNDNDEIDGEEANDDGEGDSSESDVVFEKKPSQIMWSANFKRNVSGKNMNLCENKTNEASKKEKGICSVEIDWDVKRDVENKGAGNYNEEESDADEIEGEVGEDREDDDDDDENVCEETQSLIRRAKPIERKKCSPAAVIAKKLERVFKIRPATSKSSEPKSRKQRK